MLLARVLGPLERTLYRLLRTDPERDQDWKGYARTVLVFSALFFVALYVILRTQGIHPFNPEGFGSAPWDVSFNTAASFVTQHELAVLRRRDDAELLLADGRPGRAELRLGGGRHGGRGRGHPRLRRPLGRRRSGNFWVDLTRSLLYVLLPISIIGALFLVSQGALQTLAAYVTFPTLTGGEQTLALGPVASQEVIKQLGTNGGGFFNVNSAMPFENPNGLTNFVEMLLILVDPGGADRDLRAHGRQPPPGLGALRGDGGHVRRRRGDRLRRRGRTARPPSRPPGLSGPNLEGKEQRFGIANSALWAAITTVASCGAVNAAHGRR